MTLTATQGEVSDIPKELEYRELWVNYWSNRDAFASQEKLIEAYLPFARKVLSRVMIRLPSHVRSEDLLNSALIGLYDAITRFDPKTGMHFEYFAARRIRGAILDELRACDPLTRSQRNTLGQVEQTINQWAIDHNAFPDYVEIAGSMGVDAGALMQLMDHAQPWLSLDAPLNSGEPGMLLSDLLRQTDAVGPDQEAQIMEMRTILRKSFRWLTEREQKILYLYYYEELRLHEIATLFELTEARVCQIHALAVTKLKHAVNELQNMAR